MMGYALSEKQGCQLNIALEDLLVESEAQALFISDYGGNIIAHVSIDNDDFMETVAALAAGSFSATRELAGFIGEKSFLSVYHKGDDSSIYIQCVAQEFLVLAILGKNVTQGLAKLYIDKACSRIDPILTDTIGQSLESAFAADSSGTPFEFKTEVDVF